MQDLTVMLSSKEIQKIKIMANAGEHAMKEHDIKPADMTPELKEKIRGLIFIILNFYYHIKIYL